MRRPIVSLISTLSLAKLSSAKLNVFSQPRIIGGENAEPNRYPYMVSLLKPSGVHTCGGVLVAKDVVLTAAHCR
jgi:secreted trypsin-like serine protease